MIISAKSVMELRKMTDAPMMDCKKALTEASGNMDKAIEILRTKLAVKADKRASRTAAEGVICVGVSGDAKQAVMFELNCETDFVARDETFLQFSRLMAARATATYTHEVAALLSLTVADDQELSFDQARGNLISKVGENVQLRRVVGLQADYIGQYIHGARIGVLVALDKALPELAKDIAMHIAASNPSALCEEEMDQQLLAKERDIFVAQARESGKPDNIVEKMVQGRIVKFLKESCLLSQPFVKDPDSSVSDLLKAHDATVIAFVRYELGEGIEKEMVDFAVEVQAQIQGS